VYLLRSVAAVLIGILLAYLLPRLMEQVLVASVAGRELYTAGDYFAARNTAGPLAARLVLTFFLGTLAGHMAARIAKEDAVRTVGIAAIALTAMMIWEFTAGDMAWGTPIWMRVAIVALTGPSMMLGAIARAKAAELREQS
jgi:hypothetical protein